MAAVTFAPGTYWLRHPTGRLDYVRIDGDGAAERLARDRGTGWVRVDLDEYVAAGTEPPAAGAGDGPREVLAPAGANVGHGWSVSPVRTIGNVPDGDEREAPPSPGPCQTCGTQRRERGEVRVHVWRCGCAVRPRMRRVSSGMSVHAGEFCWVAEGYGVDGAHPTESGAIAAWREALAEAQRAEDER